MTARPSSKQEIPSVAKFANHFQTPNVNRAIRCPHSVDVYFDLSELDETIIGVAFRESQVRSFGLFEIEST